MTDNVYTGDDFDDKVRKQVEFYFSDSNLQTDKFLYKIYQANDGWVELKTILTFGRMRQYRPEDKVVEALRQSEKLVLSANGETIRRKDPLKDFNELKNIRKKNTVHIEGFPKDLTLDALEEWFASNIFAKLPKEKSLASVRMVRNRSTKEFFGVVDVEFKTLEDAEFFLNDLTVAYPEGVVEGDAENKLSKMSLLTFREMRESGKRFGVNEVGKRRSSFNDNKGRKFKKNNRGRRDEKEEKENAAEPSTETNDTSKPAEEAAETKTEANETADAAETAPIEA